MKNVRKTVDKILNVCILVLFIAMFGVTTLNVIMRYVFNSPLSFAVEFGRYTFAGMVYLGSMVMVLTFILGGITPPVGVTLYIATAVAKIKFTNLLKEMWPFIALFIAVLFAVAYCPAICLTIPNMLA